MSIRERFNKAFGLKDSVEEEKGRFVERVKQVIFRQIDTGEWEVFDYPPLFKLVCFELGVNAHDERMAHHYRGQMEVPPELRYLTEDDWAKTLLVLSILYEHIQYHSNQEEGQEWLSRSIEAVLSRCTCDIGIKWKEGCFYPTGADELDEPLIEDVLTWLNGYPNERTDYRRALECCFEGQSFGDVIKNCYQAVEGVAREVLGNSKRLDKNKDELLKEVDLSNGWKSILATYIKYAHDFRHASEKRHEIKKQEAEGYLYMTGLIIRLAIESKS